MSAGFAYFSVIYFAQQNLLQPISMTWAGGLLLIHFIAIYMQKTESSKYYFRINLIGFVSVSLLMLVEMNNCELSARSEPNADHPSRLYRSIS